MLSYWMQTIDHKTVIEQRDIELPTPGPNQILLRLHAASLNRGSLSSDMACTKVVKLARSVWKVLV